MKILKCIHCSHIQVVRMTTKHVKCSVCGRKAFKKVVEVGK